MPKRTPWTGRTWSANSTPPVSPPEEIETGARQLLAKRAGISSPRPASNSAWAKSRSPPPWA
jgi:hypothetical protein